MYNKCLLEGRIEILVAKQKRNTGAKSRKVTPQWGMVSSTVALLLFVDVCAFTGYLWALPETFDHASKVISTVASWVVSLLGFLGIKKATRRQSLAAFLRLPPVALCTLAFTAGVWTFVLPIHAIKLSVIVRGGRTPLPGATIAVDGRPPEPTTSGADGAVRVGSLLAATHNLKVECDGYVPESRSAGLTDVLWGGPLLVALGHARGTINASTNPGQADIFLDGDAEHPRGLTPLPLEVDSGLHTIRFAKPGYRPTAWEQIEIRAGEPKSVLRTLIRLPTAPAAQYTVLFTSSPSGAAVYLDGGKSGNTPVYVQLAAGRHTLRYRVGSSDCGPPETIVVPPLIVPKQLEACGK